MIPHTPQKSKNEKIHDIRSLRTALPQLLCLRAFLARSRHLRTTANEARGHFTRNSDGVPTETTRLMKDYGMNAIRLRVWVNPKDGFSSPEDVLKMALRAKQLGMPVMIDFHYSDWWADPGKQYPPKAWEGMSVEETAKALADHTRETLRLLKDNGIDVKWVQVGNETTHGFLWPMGRFEENPKTTRCSPRPDARLSRKYTPTPRPSFILTMDSTVSSTTGFSTPSKPMAWSGTSSE